MISGDLGLKNDMRNALKVKLDDWTYVRPKCKRVTGHSDNNNHWASCEHQEDYLWFSEVSRQGDHHISSRCVPAGPWKWQALRIASIAWMSTFVLLQPEMHPANQWLEQSYPTCPQIVQAHRGLDYGQQSHWCPSEILMPNLFHIVRISQRHAKFGNLRIIWCVDDHHVFTSRISTSGCQGRSSLCLSHWDVATWLSQLCLHWGLDHTAQMIFWS